jgi:pyruvate-formate lyase-activating enzyme
MYTADALANEIRRGTSRSVFHSISISGRDPLANVEYICAAFEKVTTELPVMLDTDGQRPAEIAELRKFLRLVQVTVEGGTIELQSDRVIESLKVSAETGLAHALVINADATASDAHILRIVERARGTSGATAVVVHPGPTTPVDRDRRWTTLFERLSAIHNDVRLALRLPPPTGMR